MRSFLPVKFPAAIVLALVLSGTPMGAQTYNVIHAFGAGTDGGGLWSPVVFDGKGNLYGTTSGGGAFGYGTVFELIPQGEGAWAENILHSFKNNDPDGTGPIGGLVFDPLGNLYGTTVGGGNQSHGTVFELTPDLSEWIETVLLSFPATQCCPQSTLIIGKRGSLYGIDPGAAYELTHSPSGWRMAILHVFPGQQGDGIEPFGAMVVDGTGNLYGTTEHGGTSTDCGGGCGTVYEIQHLPNGTWKESVIHSFPAFTGDGTFPGFADKLAIEKAGNLYGTAGGGAGNVGVIFRLHPVGDGTWTETILHAIKYRQNGSGPSSGVVMDAAGILYGTTIAGGDASCDCGVVYKLVPVHGQWVYIVLHRFIGSDGAQPDANLTLDGKGNIFGTTATGGANGAGVVFEITP
jgi:uncharacterized repeat protein (TIGR03803 family)